MTLDDEHRYSARAPAPFWSRRRRIAETLEGPFRRLSWLERAHRWLAKMTGVQ